MQPTGLCKCFCSGAGASWVLEARNHTALRGEGIPLEEHPETSSAEAVQLPGRESPAELRSSQEQAAAYTGVLGVGHFSAEFSGLRMVRFQVLSFPKA